MPARRGATLRRVRGLAFAAFLFVGGTSACGGNPLPIRADGLNPALLPEDLQGSYSLFSDRCSKCHSIARALNSGIDTNAYWDDYVERMRRQPGSGISIDDTHVILRFLYYYAAVQRKAKSSALEPARSRPRSAWRAGANDPWLRLGMLEDRRARGLGASGLEVAPPTEKSTWKTVHAE